MSLRLLLQRLFREDFAVHSFLKDLSVWDFGVMSSMEFCGEDALISLAWGLEWRC